MEQNKKELLLEQANIIEDVLNFLRTQFEGDYQDKINFLEIVKGNLSNS